MVKEGGSCIWRTGADLLRKRIGGFPSNVSPPALASHKGDELKGGKLQRNPLPAWSVAFRTLNQALPQN